MAPHTRRLVSTLGWMGVPNRDEVRDFLTTRRAKVRPDQVDLPTGGNARRPVNLARHCFLDRDSAERYYPDFDGAADAIVGILRAEAGRDPSTRICRT
jgi:hypothetical protein